MGKNKEKPFFRQKVEMTALSTSGANCARCGVKNVNKMKKIKCELIVTMKMFPPLFHDV